MDITSTNIETSRDDKYRIYAQKYPVVITVILLIVVLSLAEYSLWLHLNWTIRILSILSSTGIVVAFSFLCARIIRRIAKDTLEKPFIFKPKRKPTTRLLIKSDTHITDALKQSVVCKLKEEEQWQLESTKVRDWNSKSYVEAVEASTSYIKDQTRLDSILFDRNCYYGFARNLYGGLFFNMLIIMGMLLTLLAMHNENWMLYGYMLIIVLVLMFFAALMAYREGLEYAERLYEAYTNK